MKDVSRRSYIPRNLSHEAFEGYDEGDYHSKRICNLVIRNILLKYSLDLPNPHNKNLRTKMDSPLPELDSQKLEKDRPAFSLPLTDDTEEACNHRTYSTDSDNFSEDYTEIPDENCFPSPEDICRGLEALKISVESVDNGHIVQQNGDNVSDAGSSESGVTLKSCSDADLDDAVESDARDTVPKQKITHSDSGSFYEDTGEFDFLKAEPVRRSTSLKTTKTPPGTPSRKKAVRFADVLGLDLESVRHIMNIDTPPKIPASATSDLKLGVEEDRRTEGNRYLTACFAQPAAAADFVTRVLDEKVSVENCLVDDQELTVTGTVRVANIAYHKSVKVRYTTNNWLTFTDVAASYIANSCDGPTDRFAFTISVPQYFGVGMHMAFAACYTSDGQMFWDNNHGRNYVIECYARSIPTVDSDNSWMHFL